MKICFGRREKLLTALAVCALVAGVAAWRGSCSRSSGVDGQMRDALRRLQEKERASWLGFEYLNGELVAEEHRRWEFGVKGAGLRSLTCELYKISQGNARSVARAHFPDPSAVKGVIEVVATLKRTGAPEAAGRYQANMQVTMPASGFELGQSADEMLFRDVLWEGGSTWEGGRWAIPDCTLLTVVVDQLPDVHRFTLGGDLDRLKKATADGKYSVLAFMVSWEKL